MLKKTDISGFSMIELLVAILIFALGLVAVYSMIVGSLKLNDYNKNFIIASNLAREQLEMFKNIRDSNYALTRKWSLINPYGSFTAPTNQFEIGAYYKIENNFAPTANFPIKVQKISDFGEGTSMLSTKMNAYRLCLDAFHRYTYTCTGSNKKTPFYRYLKIEPLEYKASGVDVTEANAWKVTSRVIWYQRGYNQTELNTIVTDWKRL